MFLYSYVKLFQEKSLVEISMFREDDQKQIKTTPTIPEQKKKGRKPATNGQFEKKLAKKLKRKAKVWF